MSVIYNEGIMLKVIPNDIVKPANLDVIGLDAKQQKHQSQPGTEVGDYRLLQGDIGSETDVTDMFTGDGYKFTEDMIEGGEITQQPLSLKLITETGSKQITLDVYLGKKPTSSSLIIEPSVTTIEPGDEFDLKVTCSNNDEHPDCTFEIMTSTSTSVGSTIIDTRFDGCTIQAGSQGTLTVRATSAFDSTVYKEITLAITSSL